MVLLVIADHASDDGTNAYPSQATIATKASISIRTVQRCVNNLVKARYVRMDKHAGGSFNCREDRRPHLYTINLDTLRGDIMTTRKRGDIEDINGATTTTATGRLLRPKNHTIEPSLEPSNHFEEFWKIYPLKVGKKPAQVAFDKAIKTAALEVILSGAKRYADDPNRHPTYTSHPTTWLNQERWGDAPLPAREISHEEKKARELAEAQERTRRERERSAELTRQDAEAREKAIPMPESLKELFKNLKV